MRTAGIYFGPDSPGKDAPVNDTSSGLPARDAAPGPDPPSRPAPPTERRPGPFDLSQSWLPWGISLFAGLLVLLIGGTVLLQLASEQAAILDEARKHTSNLA